MCAMKAIKAIKCNQLEKRPVGQEPSMQVGTSMFMAFRMQAAVSSSDHLQKLVGNDFGHVELVVKPCFLFGNGVVVAG